LTRRYEIEGQSPNLIVKQSLLYAIDDMGNITKTTQDDGLVWNYAYDNRYRLITAVRAEEATTPEIEAKYTYTHPGHFLRW